MSANWLVLIVCGLLLYLLSTAPPVPGEWRPFVRAAGGVLFVVGVVLLVLVLLEVRVT